MKSKAVKKVEASSGNVFEDLGFPKSKELYAKAQLCHLIARIIEGRGLTQGQAAKLLGTDQPKVSALVRGKLSGFSTDRLIKFLLALGWDVEIKVNKTRKARGRVRIAA